MIQHKRYTNLIDFNKNVKKYTEVSDNEFEMIEKSQIYHQSTYKNEEITFLTEEDEKIKGKIFDLASLFDKCLPGINLEEKKKIFEDQEKHLTSSNSKMYCKAHPTIQISYVCVNDSCPLSFFCNKCLDSHLKTCNKVNMYLNPILISSEENYLEIFNENQFNSKKELENVKKLVEENRSKINQQLDGILKLAEDKIISQSKEYKLLYFSKIIKKKFEKLKSNKTYMNLLDFAHETFRFEMISEMNNLPKIENQIQELKKSLAIIEKDVDNTVKKFKKSFIKSLESDKNKYSTYWKKLINEKYFNQRCKQPIINDYKIDEQDATNTTTKIFEKNTKPTNIIEDNTKENEFSGYFQNEIEKIITSTKKTEISNNDHTYSNINFEGTVIIPDVKNSLKKYISGDIKAEDIDYISQFIIPDEFKNLKLIYKFSTSKGFNVDNFNKRTKGINPSIMLCITKEGRKFGAVNYLPWGKDCENKTTDKNFIFSVDEKSKHNLILPTNEEFDKQKNNQNAMNFKEGMGPIFGNGDLVIGDKCHQTESCSSNLGNTYSFNHLKQSPKLYLANKEKFELKNLYIFHMSVQNKTKI